MGVRKMGGGSATGATVWLWGGVVWLSLWGTALLGAEEKSKPDSAPATESRMEAIEERLDRLERNLALVVERLSRIVDQEEARAALADAGRMAVEAEELKEEVGGRSESAAAAQDPAPAGVDASSGGVKRIDYGGYMEMHLTHDNINPTTLDFRRFVLLYGHQFNDRVRFVGEVELEHALVEGAEESGELELEQAYLDFLFHPRWSFRAGMMLTPVGILNEKHEPASFNGVQRTFVDTVIIPTTWFGNGAGLVGDFGDGFRIKAFAMSSLNASFFSAAEGFRDGRQKGFLENASNVAAVGRLEYYGQPGLNLGVSYWTGNTALDFPGIAGQTRILEFDGQYSRGHFDLRGQFAWTEMEDAGRINRLVQLQTGVNPNLAEQMRGFYLEGALRLFPDRRQDVIPFYRYENFDTQFRMPSGFLPLAQFDRWAHVVGVSYRPHPDIAFKFDYNFLRNASQVVAAPNRWNFGIGWWF